MQREGSHGWSRHPQMEGKGKVGSTKTMPHQHQAVDWEGCMGGSQPHSPSSRGDGERKLPFTESALEKHPSFSPEPFLGMDCREKSGTGHPQHPQNTVIAFHTSATAPSSATHHQHTLLHPWVTPSPSSPQDPEKLHFPHQSPHPSLLQPPPAPVLQHRWPLMPSHVPSSQGTPGRGQYRSLDGSRPSCSPPSPAFT